MNISLSQELMHYINRDKMRSESIIVRAGYEKKLLIRLVGFSSIRLSSSGFKENVINLIMDQVEGAW